MGGAAEPAQDCLPGLTGTGDAIAQYDFENDEGRLFVQDSMGAHDGAIQGARATLVDGPGDCGRAFSFEQDQRFFVLPDSTQWELPEGSIEFWLRVPDAPSLDQAGLISRDEEGTDAPGHLSIWLTTERRIEARLQDGSRAGVRCSLDPLPAGEWAHVLINFGPPSLELWVNGSNADRQGEPVVDMESPCGIDIDAGLSGNDLDWFVGASAYRSAAPPADLQHHFLGGAIDALRISPQRRQPIF